MPVPAPMSVSSIRRIADRPRVRRQDEQGADRHLEHVDTQSQRIADGQAGGDQDRNAPPGETAHDRESRTPDRTAYHPPTPPDPTPDPRLPLRPSPSPRS